MLNQGYALAAAIPYSSSGRLNLFSVSDGWPNVYTDTALNIASLGRNIAFSPDGARIATVRTTTPRLALVDTSSWTSQNLTNSPTITTDIRISFSPDGSKFFFAATGTHTLSLFDASSWERIRTTPPAIGITANPANFAAWSPDSTKIAFLTGASTARLRVLDVATWTDVFDPTTVFTGTGNIGICYGLCWSPDGQYIAVASVSAPRLTILNTTTWERFIPPGDPTFTSTRRHVDWSPDGNFFCISGDSGVTFNVFNVSSNWAPVALPDSGTLTSRSTRSCKFSPNSRYVATGTSSTTSGDLMIYDLLDNVLHTSPHRDGVNAECTIDWSPVPVLARVKGVIRDAYGVPVSRAFSIRERALTAIEITSGYSDPASGEYLAFMAMTREVNAIHFHEPTPDGEGGFVDDFQQDKIYRVFPE